MSDVESLFWTVDSDPHLTNTFANLSIVDRPPDIERLRRRMERASRALLRLRQRVETTPGHLTPPSWRLDDDFDVRNHVRRVELPSPATDEALDRLVVDTCMHPLDKARPLWEFVVIEGLADGRAAVLQRFHHALTDGEGGIRMSVEYLDLEREPAELPELEAPETLPQRSRLGIAVATAVELNRRSMQLTLRSYRGLASAYVHPVRTVGKGREVVGTGQSLFRQVSESGEPLSPLWRERTLQREFRRLEIPFQRSKESANRLGGTLNDLFVTGAVLAAGRIHRRAGEPVPFLRMAMPVSTRVEGSVGGNAFSPTRVLLASDIDDPKEAFAATSATLGRSKKEPAIGAAENLAGILGILPTQVLTATGRRIAGSVDFTTSNVRAAPFDLFIAGSLIEANHPVGPIVNTPFNLTMMSYRDQLCMGLHADAGSIGDVDALRDALEEAYQDLFDAAGL